MLGFFKKTKPAGASDSHASAPVSKDSTLPTAPSKNTSTVNASEEAHSARESNTNTGTELDHANGRVLHPTYCMHTHIYT